MIILTDDQAAKVRDRLEFLDSQWGAEALTILDGAQKVEVVGYVYGVMTDSCTRRSMATIQADIELKSGAPLYAVKETK